MVERGGVHFFLFEDCLIRVPTEDLAPKFGSVLLARHLPLQPGDAVLDLGAGAGLIGILAARHGHRVVATDVVPAYAECLRANALLNGVGGRLEVRTGDLFEPVSGESFDVIAANPPQMPTPPDREWSDPQSRMDNGGPDGWLLLDRIIRESPPHLKPGGRLVLTLFGFLGIARGFGDGSRRRLGAPRSGARRTAVSPTRPRAFGVYPLRQPGERLSDGATTHVPATGPLRPEGVAGVQISHRERR